MKKNSQKSPSGVGKKAGHISLREFAVAVIGSVMGIVVYRSLVSVTVVLPDVFVPLFVGVGIAFSHSWVSLVSVVSY